MPSDRRKDSTRGARQSQSIEQRNSYGWAVTYGLDPLDPNLDSEDPMGTAIPTTPNS